ncbi:DUF58 domain-containing protein [Galbitalea sp. SE-J8]|uniref:DUF58 domain-containing protein n=1 Tax=Galbitalea sp. SE-J8 TaxID=3054952 RepID=UPI00259CA3B3|nr:DUF58 domain-containing protein [Galbitalea sp. SE-J8]MDM4761537.1 DUF58 domain-containing protein [Galbitalea sp. SE-J8]
MSLETDSRISRTVATTGTATHTRYTTASGAPAVAVVVGWIRVWRAVVPAVRAAVAWVRDTVTPAGWVVVGGVVALAVGLALGWVELVVAGLLAAVLLACAVPFLFGGQAYAVELQLHHERVVAGDVVEGSVVVTNASSHLALPGRIDIPTGAGLAEVHVPLLVAGAVHSEQLAIRTEHRGIIAVGPVTSVRTDPLGLLKREVAWVDLRDIYVHPVTVPIPSTSAGFIRDLEGDPSRRIVDADISFHAIRPYARGDAQRSVHWKSTAKQTNGSLMVRQFEETRRSRLAIVLSLDVAEYADDEEFELAVSVAGSLGVRAVRDSRDLAVVMSEEIPEFMRRSMRSIRSLATVSGRALLDDLAGIDARATVMPIEEVCRLTAQVVTDVSIAVVVCGSAMDARRLQSVAVTFPLDVRVLAIVCDRTAPPAFRELPGLSVATIALLDDLGHLMAKVAR